MHLSRGGCLTKWKGEAASYAPNLAQLIPTLARPRNATFAALAFIMGAAASPAMAQDANRYWDADGSGIGFGGTGTWNTTNPPLWNSSDNAVAGPFFTWNNAGLDNAIFAGTAGTVTLGAPITVHNLTFEVNGYTIAGGTLTLDGTTPTITVNAGTSAISSIVAGTSGLTKDGAGALTLSGNNTFSGNLNVNAGTLSLTGTNGFTGAINVNAGTLLVGSNEALGDINNSVTLNDSATFWATGALSTNRQVVLNGSATVRGAGVGSALVTGTGTLTVMNGVTMSNDASSYTGQTILQGAGQGRIWFTSVRDTSIASSLGANGDIVIQGVNNFVDLAIYTGDGDSTNRTFRITPSSNGGVGLVNQGTGTLALTGTISLEGSARGISLSANSADLDLSGPISGTSTSTVTYSGTSTARTITLGGANTYTGANSISAVTLTISTLADRGTASSLGTNDNTGAEPADIQINGGVLDYTGSGHGSNRTWQISNLSSVLNNGTGALALSGAVTFDPVASIDTLTLGGSFAGENTISGDITGSGGVVMDGAGTWALTGATTFTGGVTVQNGTLRADTPLSATTSVTVNGGTLDLNGNDLSLTSLAGTGGTVALGSGDLTLNLGTGVTNSYAGSITGTGGSLTKLGAGTLTLTGQSTYTGATTIGGGTLALDFSPSGGPTSNIISASSPLIMNGGTVRVTGAAGETNIQSFGGLTVTTGNNTVSATSDTGGSTTISLGGITRTGGLANFVLPTAGAITTTGADRALGGWATVNGTDYAKVVSGNIVAFTASDYVQQDDASLWQSNQILSDSGGAANTPFFNTVGASIQIGGLQYTVPRNSTVTVADGQTLGVDGTIIVAPSVGAANQTITGGAMTGTLGGGVLGVQQNGTGTFTIASTIVDNTGTVGFSKAGTGRVALTGLNTYTGATTVSQGTLSINSVADAGIASAIGAASTNPSNLVIEGATLEYTGTGGSTNRGFTLARSGAVTASTISVTNAAANLTVSGQVVSPDGANFIKTGPGTLTLSNPNNTYTGTTTVSGGTLAVTTLANGGSPSSIGAADNASSNLVLQGGGELEYLGGTTTSNRGFTLGSGGGAIDVAQGATTLTMSGVAAGAGSLTKNGPGTLVLSGANTYTGGTTVSAGILRAGSANAFGTGAITVNSPATLDIADIANVRTGGLGGDGTVNLGVLSTTRYIIDGNGSVFSGIISGAGGVTLGSGPLTVSGCKNTYAGPTTIWGTLAVSCLANGGSPSDIGASGAAPTNLVLAGGTLNYVGDTVTTDRGFTTGGWITVSKAATTLTFTGQATGGGQLVKLGPGTLVLSGTNNYTGGTTVSGGILRAGSTSAFGTGGMTVNTATLDLANLSNTVSGLAGAGNVTLGSATLTLSHGAGLTFSGGISGTGGLVKSGPGTQTLSGTASSYTGPTVVNGGVLAVASLANGNNNSSIGASSNAATNLVLNGGTLQYNGTGGSTDRQFTLGTGGGTLDASGTGAINFTSTAPVALPDSGNRTLTLSGANTGNNTLSARIDNPASGTTSVTKTGTGTWVLENAGSTYTGVTTISGGVLAVDKLADGGEASSIGRSSNAASSLVIGSGSTLRYTGTGDTTNRLFTLSTGITLIESSGTGAIVFSNTGSAAYTGSGNRTLALGGTNTGLNTMGGTIINGPGGLTTVAKNDSGTWALTGNNTYSGNTVVNAGSLMIGNGGGTGNAGTGNVIVNAATSTLSFNRNNTFNFAGTLSGPGNIAQIGTGTTVLTSATNMIGAARIDAGTLQVGDGTATGSLTTSTFAMNAGTLTVAANGTVSAAAGAPTTMTGSAGAATININSGGILRASGDLEGGSDIVNVSGTLDTGAATKLSLGGGNDTLVLNDSAVFSGGGVDAGSGGESGPGDTLAVNTTAGRTLDGATVTNFESLNKLGTGTLTLTGDHVYSAGSSIQAGTLQIGAGGASGTLAGNVANEGTLAFNRSDALAYGGVISGSGVVQQNGSGTTVLTGANTYSGATQVNAGTLLVHGNQSAATGLTSVASGATLGGTGIIGGNVTVADGGTLSPGNTGPVAGTLTINGNLALSGGSTLDYNFGEPDVEGGPLNDLIRVGGNLALDGALNVSQTTDGTFGPGVYRIIAYNGTLADNGLTVTGSDLAIQTSVAGQVNLINTTGLAFSYWDGDAGPKNNNAVNGGSGTWLASGGNNWTDHDGAMNAGFDAGSFAVFQGTAGTVTVDAGGVSASGMQFMTDGYVVQGGAITLVADASAPANLASVIRVGDGTADGTSYLATISSELAGSQQLVKTDLGTLVLTGTNSYTGGTTINGGTLRISSNANLGEVTGGLTFNGGTLHTTQNLTSARAVTLTGAATFLVDGATTTTLNGSVAGAGPLTKSGDGTLVLTASGNSAGGTSVTAGLLQVDGDLTTPTLAMTGTSALTVNGTIEAVGAGPAAITGDAGAATITVGTGGTLRANGDLGAGSDIVTLAGLLDTAGGRLRLGDGDDSLTLADSAAINGAGVDGGTGTDALVADNASTLILDGASVTGFESLTKQNSGTLTLIGDHAYGNGTAVQGGALYIGNGGTSGTLASDVAISNGAALAFNRSDSYTFAGLITGAGTVQQIGGGITILTADNSYTGETQVSAGTLIVNGNQSAANGQTWVTTGGTLGGIGIIGGDVDVADGTISPGDLGAAPGTLNVNGNLTLAGTSALNYNFGQAGVEGGPLNDLIRVGGGLTLDGTINVTETAGGNFGPGIYRVISYAGGLNDQGLTVTSPNYVVQTAVAQQVNLVNTTGVTLNFWDGDAGPKGDDAVDGGDGTWRAGGDDNWTDKDGQVNAAYQNGGYPIFAGTAGTVTVDTGGVSASGMQFATGGYTIQDSTITLAADAADPTNPASVIRVGDGTADGAAYVATISSALTGTQQLVKDDLGTLVLSGTNSYTGGTAINGGTLSISSDANLGDAAGGLTFNGGTLATTASLTSNRDVTLAGAGRLLTDAGTTTTLTQAVTGAGALTKDGAGTLVLAADNSYQGGTTIAAGTLQVGNGAATGSITGDVTNNGTLTFNRTGVLTYAGAITGTGAVNLTGGAGYTFTGDSNYSGNTTINGGSGLTLSGGGSINGTASTTLNDNSTLTVSGAGSELSTGTLRVGEAAGSTSKVVIDNGGVVKVGGDANFGGVPLAADAATLTVNGAGSSLQVGGALLLGTRSQAALDANIADGAQILSNSALMGAPFTSLGDKKVTLSGAGTSWTNTTSLNIRSGTLSVLDGAQLSTGSFDMTAVTVPAALIVSGANAIFSSAGDLAVKGAGTSPTVTLADDGELRVGGQLALGASAVLNIGGGEGQPAAAAGTLDAPTLTFATPGTGRVNFNHTETDYAFATAMSGVGTINQVAGVTHLTGDSSGFAGTTSVSGGTLLVDGTLGNAASTVGVTTGTLGGTGVIGGGVTVADGAINPGQPNAVGTLAINGGLALGMGSALNYDFGQANVPGGSLNDLLTVGGDLTLDGTLNVSQTAGGSFGPGLYRIISYSGTLTDNGLQLGTLPAGAQASVQTSIANQVNLVNSGGLPLSYWDGDLGPKNDGAINGGDGIWRATGDDNWTDVNGAANAPYSNGSFAIFAGKAGTVSVDTTNGEVRASGMQFATDGYTVQGGSITLVPSSGTQAIVRVGDGTADGAGYTATIAAALTGSAGLAKTDAGTLALTGTSSYTGATDVLGGTLAVDGAIASSAVTVHQGARLTGNGTVGGLTVAAGATVAPGHSIGTLQVAGTYTQASGATYQVEVDPTS
ncbi:beta strand repeat-containing protein, partial [Chelatococcus sp. GCM10030263]|uniref:beta strand repeat-containing protein n=1 Tax=Chelatococcus sp. GCM10030263 TaxID=3273387 RepID=UPI00360F24B4